VETARRTGSQLVTTVKGWPRNVQIAAAAGVAAVVLLGSIVVLSGGGGDDDTPTQAGNVTSAPAAPAFETQRHAERGVAVNVPQGWKRSGGTGVFFDYTDPADKGRRVRILVESSKAEPIRFLQGAGNRLRENVSKNCARPYEQIGLAEVEVAGKPAAELEYTCGSGDSMRHGVWRAIVEGGKAYSFYLTTPESKFADSKQIFDEMVRTFQLTA
jgi:hypothetical protein